MSRSEWKYLRKCRKNQSRFINRTNRLGKHKKFKTRLNRSKKYFNTSKRKRWIEPKKNWKLNKNVEEFGSSYKVKLRIKFRENAKVSIDHSRKR